jgi:dUTP pyrophosphatase
MNIELKVLNKAFYEEYSLPHYATAGSAGIDLKCTEDVIIYPGEVEALHTGISLHIGSDDKGTVGLILPRSSLGTKGLVLANTIGIIDEDYQGELLVQAWNRNTINYETHTPTGVIELKAGDRIAQLLFVPIIKATFNIVEKFSNKTTRGDGGFGSTGK